MRVAVVAFSCRGVMGLGAVSLANFLSEKNDVALFGGNELKSDYIYEKVKFKKYSILGQGPREIFKFNILIKTLNEIKTFNPQLIIFYSSHIFNCFVARLKKMKTKKLFILHDPHIRAKYRIFSKQDIFNKLMEFHNLAMIKNVDIIQVTYKNAIEEVIERYNLPAEKICSVPLLPLVYLKGTDKNKNYKKIKYDYDLVFFGRIDAYKDLDLLFKTLEMSYSYKNRLKLLMIIQGNIPTPFKIKYKQVLNDIDIINQFLNEHDFESLIRRSKIAIFPYHDATGSHGPSVAFSLGMPIVATDVGCFKEYINMMGYGIVVPPGRPDLMYKAIINILNNPIENERISAKFIDFVKNMEDYQLSIINRMINS